MRNKILREVNSIEKLVSFTSTFIFHTSTVFDLRIWTNSVDQNQTPRSVYTAAAYPAICRDPSTDSKMALFKF